ncbi:MAG: hypothetical protein GF364_17530 [Candidatus Lokiarchaeota archaeon]|nr:hypothetical protein [Candidatus Lokiarchaeota archaeon]
MTEIDLAFLAGPFERPECPAKVKVPLKIEKPVVGTINLDEEDTQFPAYIVPLDKKYAELYTIVPPLKKNAELGSVVTINKDASLDSEDGVKLENVSENQIKVTIGGKDFTSVYLNAKDAQRPYLYPLLAPCGVGVTRNWPIKKDVSGDSTDHVHHKSCWTAWGDINGVDNWSDGRKKGRQETKKILEVVSSPVFGKVKMHNIWTDRKGREQISEIRDIVFYNTKNVRLVDFTISLKATQEDLTFGDTKEGGFLSIRVATPMEVKKKQGGKIQNSFGGKNEGQTWGKRAQWCDYSGIVDEKEAGVAIFDNPANYMFPTYWHVRNYGLMGANPLGISHFLGRKNDGSIILKKGGSLVFKYRLVVHDGYADDANLQEHYLNYYYPCSLVLF